MTSASTPAPVVSAEDMEKLRKLSEAATPGPWEADTCDTEGGDGKYTGNTIVDARGKVICDTINGDLQTIHEHHEYDAHSVWDEQGRCDMALAAASVNFVRSLLAPDGPIAAMQAEHQRTVERLNRILRGEEHARGECIHCEWPVECHEAHKRIASLEAQLSEAKKALTIIEQKSFAALADVRCARSAKETNDVG